MGEIVAKGPVKEATIEAVVIRKDGTREDLGVIAQFKRKPTLKERISKWLHRCSQTRRTPDGNLRG